MPAYGQCAPGLKTIIVVAWKYKGNQCLIIECLFVAMNTLVIRLCSHDLLMTPLYQYWQITNVVLIVLKGKTLTCLLCKLMMKYMYQTESKNDKMLNKNTKDIKKYKA